MTTSALHKAQKIETLPGVSARSGNVAGAAAVLVTVLIASCCYAQTPYQQAVLDDNPVLYWTFDEAGDTDNAKSLIDDDPANELIALGAATRVPSTTTTGGVDLGRAATFDAAADPQSRFHAANLAPDTPLEAFAVELWFIIDDAANVYFSEMFAEGGASNQPGVIYNFNPGEFELFAGGRTGTEVTADEWHHVVAAYYGAGDGVEIYVDGVARTALVDRGGGFNQVHSFGEFAIGNTVRNPQSVTGQIDEYAIYDLDGLADLAARQAHVADISEHYNLSTEGIDPNLVTPGSVNFGVVSTEPSSVPLQLAISNTGESRMLMITAVNFGGPDAARFTLDAVDGFPATLGPGESGSIKFAFDSGGEAGAYSATAEIVSDDPANPTTTVAISVTARAPALAPSTPYQVAVVEDNPVLYWTFDEAEDTGNARSLVNDDPANELIARGAATRGPSTTTAGGADLGRAATFDAAADPQSRFHAANLAPDTPLDAFAVELWFIIDDAANVYFSEMFAEGGASNQPGVIYNFNPGEFELFAGGRTGIEVTADEWHHVVAASYGAGDGVEIYVDGVAQTPLVDRGGGFNQVHSFGEFAIGNTVRNPQSVTGQIDEYAIYDLDGLADLAARKAHVADIAGHYSLSAEGIRITDIVLVESGPDTHAEITFTSRNGRIYTVSGSTDLMNWEELDDGVVGEADSTTFRDPRNLSGVPEQFYFVEESR